MKGLKDIICEQRCVYEDEKDKKKCGKIKNYTVTIELENGTHEVVLYNDIIAIGDEDIEPYRGECLGKNLGIL